MAISTNHYVSHLSLTCAAGVITRQVIGLPDKVGVTSYPTVGTANPGSWLTYLVCETHCDWLDKDISIYGMNHFRASFENKWN